MKDSDGSWSFKFQSQDFVGSFGGLKVKVKVKVKLRFSVPGAGIAEIAKR